jgi:hypothetical protein
MLRCGLHTRVQMTRAGLVDRVGSLQSDGKEHHPLEEHGPVQANSLKSLESLWDNALPTFAALQFLFDVA